MPFVVWVFAPRFRARNSLYTLQDKLCDFEI